MIYGGDEFVGSQYLFGGYGDDKLIGGQGLVTAMETQTIYGDHDMGAFPDDTQQGKDIAADTGYGLTFRGLPEDGDDLIDLGDTAAAAGGYGIAFGQGGNDKIFGGLMNTAGQQDLYGGDGDDKIWTLNPGQIQDTTKNTQINYLHGGDGNDIVYGN